MGYTQQHKELLRPIDASEKNWLEYKMPQLEIEYDDSIDKTLYKTWSCSGGEQIPGSQVLEVGKV